MTYQYDSLNRLLSASSSQAWSETYGFDGFGNLLSKTPTGGAPALSIAVDPATNHIVGQTYDANGNQTSNPLGNPVGPVGYDAWNRLENVSSAGVHYMYDSRNKRIWKSTLSGANLTQEVYFYGVDGQKLGTYAFQLSLNNGNLPVMTDSSTGLAVFFGGKRLGIFDRLGTAKNNSNWLFYPYGEDRGTVQPNDTLKFATYTRDAATGLDYADQRYYANNFGRFMSPDPYQTSDNSAQDPANPQNWNRFAYVLGDPMNFYDPAGLQAADADGCTWDDKTNTLTCSPQQIITYTLNGKVGTFNLGAVTVVGWGSRPEQRAKRALTAVNDVMFQASTSCLQEQVGNDISAALAAAAALAGQNWVSTGGKFGGATSGTSVISQFLSTLLPYSLPITVPTFTNAGLKFTSVLGRALGRWAPIVGYVFLALDFEKFTECVDAKVQAAAQRLTDQYLNPVDP